MRIILSVLPDPRRTSGGGGGMRRCLFMAARIIYEFSNELVRTRIEDFSKLCFAFFARFAVSVDESPQRARRF
ncbi:MAG: hypothetical protein WA102_07110 [Candidatus Methanoperedens sp.]